MRRGYLTPPVLIGLAIICFGVAATLFLHSYLINESKKEPPQLVSQLPSHSPLPSPIECADIEAGEKPVKPANLPSDWKTYFSQEYGYTLHYPPSWELTKPKKREGAPYWQELVVNLKAEGSGIGDYVAGGGLAIWLHCNVEGQTLEEWLQNQVLFSEVLSSERVLKEGVEGVRRELGCKECTDHGIAYYFPIGQMFFEFDTQASHPDPSIEENYWDMVDQVYELFQLPTVR